MASFSTGVIAVGTLSLDDASYSDVRSSLASPGDAFLCAVGAWLAGFDAAICSVIPPEFPVGVLQRLARTGIDLSRVRLASAAEAAAGPLEPISDQLASVSPSWVVHLAGISPARQRECLRMVSQRVAITTIDAAYRPDVGRVDARVVLGLALNSDVLLSSRDDVARLWPKQQPRDVLRLLNREQARAAVIRLGSGGSIGSREGSICWMPAFPIKTRPRWPGGDAYAGAFAATFSTGRSMARAMAWATAAASAVVESASPLELINDFARRTVASRARLLEKEAGEG